MELTDTPEIAAFRAECRAWLAANAAPRAADAGTSITGVLGSDIDSDLALSRARAYQRRAAADGWAAISWPREHGGRDATFVEQVVFGDEASRFDVPDQVFRIGIMMGGPTVIAHGTEEQRARWLPPLLTGAEIWCQLFSEPGAGSDLAGLRTSAERDGDEWVINGQKVWSSGAHYSRWGMLLARTDPTVPKHQGITYFMLDMETPGIEVRPLRQMTGAAHFNEVFFTEVRVPDTDRLGAIHDGWRVAQTTLLNERAAIAELIGAVNPAFGLAELARTASAEGRAGIDDPRVRQRLADAYTQGEILRYVGLRIVSAFSRGTLPGPEASVAKLAMAEMLRSTSTLALALLGPAATASPSPWVTGFLAAPAVRIAGGSDEIQRNIIGERVLGLPKEPGPPRDTPFRDLPVSSA
jgi:alkylation response protein AidB-like acyl-CoA dehydrogenase